MTIPFFSKICYSVSGQEAGSGKRVIGRPHGSDSVLSCEDKRKPLISIIHKNRSSAKKDRRPVSVKPDITLQNHSNHKVINSAGDHADGNSYHEKTVKQLIAFFLFRGGTKDQGTAGRKWADSAGLSTKDRAGK